MMNEQDRILLLHQKWTGVISEADRIRLEEELASDEAFRKEAEWLESFWDQAKPSGLEFRPNVEIGLASFREKMHAEPRKQPVRLFRLPRLLRVAAAAALLIVAWYAVRLYTNSTQIVAEGTILAAQVLPDQSRVWLNEGSTLEFPKSFHSKTRRVVLTGEAYFEVDADPSRPFIVKTPKGEVRVTGTKFNVRAYAKEDFEEVFVREGKVRFRSRKGKGLVDLTGGQKAVLKKSTPPQLTPPIASQEFPLLWLGEEDVIAFRGVPLREVLSSMGRYLRVDFDTALLSASVLDCPASFTFLREDGVNTVIDVIKLQTKIEFSTLVENQSYLLTGGDCI